MVWFSIAYDLLRAASSLRLESMLGFRSCRLIVGSISGLWQMQLQLFSGSLTPTGCWHWPHKVVLCIAVNKDAEVDILVLIVTLRCTDTDWSRSRNSSEQTTSIIQQSNLCLLHYYYSLLSTLICKFPTKLSTTQHSIRCNSF